MVYLVLGSLLVICAISVLMWRSKDRTAAKVLQEAGGRRQAIPYLGWGAGVIFALAFLAFVMSVTFQVPTKEEAILTSFGKPSGHHGNGIHLKKPWEKSHNMDAARQTDVYEDQTSDKVCHAIPVRIAFQQTGCTNVSIQWRIRTAERVPEKLYQDFRSFDHVRDALVTRQLKQALNVAFADYNPLNISSEASTEEDKLPEIAEAVKRAMADDPESATYVGDQIEVISVQIPIVTYDGPTQDRINQLQQQVALTKIAEQRKTTNQKEAAANKALAESVNNSPNVLVSRCLDTMEAMVKARVAIPAGFSCWPGSGVAAVIAGPKG